MHENILQEIWNFFKIKYDIQKVISEEEYSDSYNFFGFSNQNWKILDDLILNIRTDFNVYKFLTNKPYRQLNHFIELIKSNNSDNLRILNIIINTFKVLDNKKYGAIKKEYLDALNAFNSGRYQDTLVHSNKALESLLKCICDDRSIYMDKDTVNSLVEILKNHNFFDNFVYLIANINNLTDIFQTGVNSLRNKSAAHDGGLEPYVPDSNLAQLSLNLSISYINFLININEKTI